ncbi:hypothetical protein BK809_0002823 [Diplodia seriata]|uniref:Uncharacterized protein n=1 Tax=Diplodia seriata TaxID=420778 RepID=A0A1S8BKQ4_9PEZI|nr:hypothetical protein BK809_0002823 [Diplodia seriata]
MDHLRRLIPSRTTTTTSPGILATTTITALTTILLVLGIRDYRAFIALGPGGVPHNVLGWAAITLLIRPFALSKAQATRTDDYPQDDDEGVTREGGKAHAGVLALPRRRGERAEVGGIAPHRQLSQHAGAGMGEVSEFSSFE